MVEAPDTLNIYRESPRIIGLSGMIDDYWVKPSRREYFDTSKYAAIHGNISTKQQNDFCFL